MNYREALNKTFQTFKLKASDVAEASGIDAGRLSKFRNGHNDLYAAALADVVAALPPEAKAYYYMLLLTGNTSSRAAESTGQYKAS